MLNIYSDIKGENIEKTIKEMAGKDFSYFKPKLSEILVETISPIGNRIKDLLKDETFLNDVIKKGKEKPV